MIITKFPVETWMNWKNFMYKKLCQHNFKYQTEGCLTANFLVCLLIELTKSQSQTDYIKLHGRALPLTVYHI